MSDVRRYDSCGNPLEDTEPDYEAAFVSASDHFKYAEKLAAENERLKAALLRLVSAARDVDTGYMDGAIAQADTALKEGE